MDALLSSLSPEDLADLEDRLYDVSSGNSSYGKTSYLFDELEALAEAHRELFKPVFKAHGLDYQERVGITGRLGLVDATITGRKLEFESLSHYWGGEPNRHWFTLPLRYLLPDGQARMARDAQLLARGLARRAAAKAKRDAERHAEAEKALLLKLLAKHGLPKEFSHG